VHAMRGTKPCASHAPTSRAPSFSHEGMALLSNSIDSASEGVGEKASIYHIVRFIRRLLFVVLY